jgi:hypothetical protein
MPSGTGKTVSLLSLIVSYQQVLQMWLPKDTPKPFASKVLPYTAQTNILLAHSTWDWEGPNRTQTTARVSHRACWVWSRKGKGMSFYGAWPNKQKKSLPSSGGPSQTWFRPSYSLDMALVSRYPKKRKARLWMRDVGISQMPSSARKAGLILVLSNYAIGTRYIHKSFQLCPPYSYSLRIELGKVGTGTSHTTGHMDSCRFASIWSW